jgi:hypothetical protein
MLVMSKLRCVGKLVFSAVGNLGVRSVLSPACRPRRPLGALTSKVGGNISANSLSKTLPRQVKVIETCTKIV